MEKGIAPLSREGTWRTYSLEDGLAEYRFVHIAEDAKGFLWFTTAHSGVNRFDGSEFETEEMVSDWPDGAWRQDRLSPGVRTAIEEAVSVRSATLMRRLFREITAEAPAFAAHIAPMMQALDLDAIGRALKEVHRP